jgi:hypothetical protein
MKALFGDDSDDDDEEISAAPIRQSGEIVKQIKSSFNLFY